MLRFLRKYSKSTGIKVLYGFLAALFVFWGVGAVGEGQRDVVAQVYEHAITRSDLDKATLLLQRRYESVFKGAQFPMPTDLRSRALDELIDDALIRHEAASLGFEVSDGELVAAITTMPDFQENGRFNREIVERVLRAQRDRGEFEEQIRRGLLSERVQSLVTDGVQVSDAEVEEKYKLDREQVDLWFVRIAAADAAKNVTVGEEELETQLEKSADRYRVPTKIRARYVVYRPGEFASQVTVSEADVTRFYEDRKEERFAELEQVRARHVLVKLAPGADDAAKAAARKKAEDVLAKAKAGEDFAELAKKSSDDPGSASKGGDLGLFPRGRMVPTFDQAAFALQAGELSDVVESPFGFHVIKVEEHRQAGVKPLDEVRAEITEVLKKERGLDMARLQAETDRRAVVKGKTLVEAVGGRPVSETEPFGEGDPVSGVGLVKGFTEAAFALDDGQVSDLVESDDAVFLLAPFGRVEAHTATLDEVRERVRTDATRARGEALAKARGETLLARAKEVGLERAAADDNVTLDSTGRFERRAPSIPKLAAAAELRNDAFALTTASPLGPKVYAAGGDAVLVALKERVPADMAAFASAKDGLKDSLLQQKRYAAYTAYMNMLKEQAQRDGALLVESNGTDRG